MITERGLSYPKVDSFEKDGRKPLHELYETYFSLLKEGWTVQEICVQEEKQENGEVLKLPIYGFLSPKQNKHPESALWVIGGIHGEEPAPAEAFFSEIETIKSLPDNGISVAAIFMANPSGYHRDWRYFNLHRKPVLTYFPSKSVGDTDHLVGHPLFKILPRKFKANNQYSDAITKWILEIGKDYKPLLLMDHHEDELRKTIFHSDWDYFYSYAYGNKKILEILCPKLVQILEKSEYSVQNEGKTRFREPIDHGFVKNSMDGSLDQFFTEKEYFDHWKIKDKNGAKAAFVLETIIHHENPQPISNRARIHQDIIKSYPELWEIVKRTK